MALDWAGSAGERPTYARYPPPILAVVTTSRRHGGRSVPDEYRNTLALLAMLRRHERPRRGFSPPTLVSSRAAPLFFNSTSQPPSTSPAGVQFVPAVSLLGQAEELEGKGGGRKGVEMRASLGIGTGDPGLAPVMGVG